MKVRYDNPAEMIAWAAEQLGGAYRDDARAIGVEHDGQIRAVAVFDTFSRRNVNLSVVSNKGDWWLTKEFARAVCAYAFITCKMPRLTVQPPASNAPACALALGMGCLEEGRMREAGPGGVDVIIYGLLRRDCRFLPKGLELSLAILS